MTHTKWAVTALSLQGKHGILRYVPQKNIHTDHREENPVMLLIISSQRNCFYEKCFLFTEILYYQILITKDFEKYKIWK